MWTIVGWTLVEPIFYIKAHFIFDVIALLDTGIDNSLNINYNDYSSVSNSTSIDPFSPAVENPSQVTDISRTNSPTLPTCFSRKNHDARPGMGQYMMGGGDKVLVD